MPEPQWNAELVAELERERARLQHRPIWAPASREAIAELVAEVHSLPAGRRSRRRLRAVS